jgi:hypothetical protein
MCCIFTIKPFFSVICDLPTGISFYQVIEDPPRNYQSDLPFLVSFPLIDRWHLFLDEVIIGKIFLQRFQTSRPDYHRYHML